jgi:hypothetical protein
VSIELRSNSQQHFIDVLSPFRLTAKFASAPVAIGGNAWERHIDIVEVKVAFASEHSNLFKSPQSLTTLCIS